MLKKRNPNACAFLRLPTDETSLLTQLVRKLEYTGPGSVSPQTVVRRLIEEEAKRQGIVPESP